MFVRQGARLCASQLNIPNGNAERGERYEESCGL